MLNINKIHAPMLAAALLLGGVAGSLIHHAPVATTDVHTEADGYDDSLLERVPTAELTVVPGYTYNGWDLVAEHGRPIGYARMRPVSRAQEEAESEGRDSGPCEAGTMPYPDGTCFPYFTARKAR